MRATLARTLGYLALALPAHAPAADGGGLWGCAPVGERRNILYLADQGGRSYIKFSGQRISASLSSNASEQRWSWGANAIVLDNDGMARYFEGDTLKAQFKCKSMQ